VEYYKWIAPLWNLHNTEKGKASHELHKDYFYTELTKDGLLVPKWTPEKERPKN
jgi:hypothetical protein